MQNSYAFEQGPWDYACVKIEFLCFCQYTHGVACQLSWPHDILLCVLITNLKSQIEF